MTICGLSLKTYREKVTHEVGSQGRTLDCYIFTESITLLCAHLCPGLESGPAKKKYRPAEFLVGACRAESTDQWTAASGISVKIPPFFDGSTSWFKYDELIDDWLNLTQLEPGKRGPALKNSLLGDESMYKGLLERESLRSEDEVQVFHGYFETPLHQRSSECFPLLILHFIRARGENMEMVKWIETCSLLIKLLKDSRMDTSTTNMYLLGKSETRRQNQFHADMARGSEERRHKSQELVSRFSRNR